MYVRLVEFSGADAEKHDSIVETMRDNVIPTLHRFEGFYGFIGMYDGENGRAKAVLLWDTKEQAEAAETELVPRRRRIAGGLGMTVESEELYEALAVDVDAVRA
jgi:hypothetical protein